MELRPGRPRALMTPSTSSASAPRVADGRRQGSRSLFRLISGNLCHCAINFRCAYGFFQVTSRVCIWFHRWIRCAPMPDRMKIVQSRCLLVSYAASSAP